MTARPEQIARSAVSVSANARLSTLSRAVRRLARLSEPEIWSAAWRRYVGWWPVWIGGVELAVVAAPALDRASVGWARGLPDPVVHFFQWITVYGKSDWLLVPSGVLCLLLLFGDWRGVGRRIAAVWAEVGILVGFAFLSIAGSGILTNIIKQLVGRGRPSDFDRSGAFSSMPFQFDYAHASFPSGHATTMGALAVVVAAIAPRARWPAFILCGLVASSRVFVGSHFPSDVVAGFLLGAAFAWFCALVLAEAGIGFAPGPGGTIRARAVAIREVLGRPEGLPTTVAGLWSAIVGSGSRADSST